MLPRCSRMVEPTGRNRPGSLNWSVWSDGSPWSWKWQKKHPVSWVLSGTEASRDDETGFGIPDPSDLPGAGLSTQQLLLPIQRRRRCELPCQDARPVAISRARHADVGLGEE